MVETNVKQMLASANYRYFKHVHLKERTMWSRNQVRWLRETTV